ncbi:hypothetical protein EON67_07890 [archaeon]|nr:MAG: hypothetical protein EON67_07890 [archaeon]
MFANRVAAAACRGYGGIGVQRHCIAPSSSAARRGARFVSTAVATPAAGFQKPRLVVLGTGWGAFSLLHDIDRRLFDVHVVRCVARATVRPTVRPTAHPSHTDTTRLALAFAREVSLA